MAKLSIAILAMISAMALAAPARAVLPDDVAGLPPEAQFDHIVQAYLRFIVNLSKERGEQHLGPPPLEITRVRVKDCAAQPAQNRMIWLYGEGQPVAFTRAPYWSARGKQYYIYPD